jgi:hypothetical protein
MGIKQTPWWTFLKYENQMVPLLHCMISIGNNLLENFWMNAEGVALEQQIATYEIIIDLLFYLHLALAFLKKKK